MKQLILFLCILLSWEAQAQKLTLEDCRKMAVETNRRLKNASLATQNAKDNLQAYTANYLPRFSLTGNYLYSNSAAQLTIPGGYLPTYVPNAQTGGLDPNILMIKPDGTPVFKEYAFMPETNFDFKINSLYTAGILLEQPIYMGGKITASVRMAKIGTHLSALNEKKSEKEVIEQVDAAFWTCIKMDELLKSAIRYREVVSEFNRQMENAYSGGMKHKNDLMKVQVRMNEAELQFRQAENGVKLARMNLCYQIGLPLNTYSLELTDTFEEITRPTEQAMDITDRPEYGMLLHQIDLKKQEQKLVRSDFLPQVAAVASYSYMNGLKMNGNTLIDKASFMGGVTVNIPLFHWGEGRKKVSSAGREIEMAKNQLDDLSQQMQLELMQAINRYDEAQLEVVLMEKSVAQTEENMRLSRNQYDVGLETLAYYLESQAIWQKATGDLIDARARKRLAYTHYLKAAGKL